MDDHRMLEAVGRWNLWGGQKLRTGIPRQSVQAMRRWLHRPEALVVCGIRRCGKSTVMRQLAETLVSEGACSESILFVNFEEPLFHEQGLGIGLLDRLLAVHRQSLSFSGPPHLFFHEIHNVPGWERWARVRLDAGEARMVLSGSSSRLLEPDEATVLTGRAVTHTLWPLSFREFLTFRQVDVSSPPDPRMHATRLQDEVLRYLRHGGLPEVVLAQEPEIRETLLRQYFRDILYRDVVSRHEVRDVRALEALAVHLLANTANMVTFNRLKDGLGLAMDQVRSYASHLEESYLVRFVPRFSFKTTEQQRAPRKVYATDTGLRNAVAFSFSPDLGRLAETLVARVLLHDNDVRLYYHQGRRECDFVVWKGAQAIDAIQVCFDSQDNEVPERELAGLYEAMEQHGLSSGTLVTSDREATVSRDGRTLRLLPLRLWLLESDAPHLTVTS